MPTITPVFTPTILARNAGALYGVTLGNIDLKYCLTQTGTTNEQLNSFLNSVYIYSVAGVTNLDVATQIVHNFGIPVSTLPGSAYQIAYDYVVHQLDATPYALRGQEVSQITFLFANLTDNPVFGTYATAYNVAVQSALSYAESNTGNAPFDAANPVGQTFILTIDVDTITPTSNATVNGILGGGAPTINSFDSVKASGSNVTFNISDVGTGFAMPSLVTLSGLETVNLVRSAAASGNVVVTDTTFGTGIQHLNLSDTNTVSSGTVEITLKSATSVSAINTGVAAFTSVIITDTSLVSTAAGSLLATVTAQGVAGFVDINGNGVTTVNLNDVGGLTTITSAAGTRALVVNLAGTNAMNGLTDAKATTVTINNTVTAALGLGTYTAAAATTVNFNTTTANVATTIAAAAATTLNVGGSALATLDLAGSTALTTVSVNGTAGLAVDLTAAATLVTALNFTNTAGTSTVTINNGTAVSGGAGIEKITVALGTKAINLGTGSDTLILTGAGLGVAGTANGGAGDTDVLQMTTANAALASATTAMGTAITGFERLTLTTNTASAVNLANLGGYNYVTIANGALATTLTNLASGGTVVIDGANTGGLVLNGTSGSGLSDSVNLKLNNVGAGALDFGTVDANGIESVAVVVSDTNATPDLTTNYFNTLAITDAGIRSFVVSGTDGLAVNLGGTATLLSTFDASGITSGDGTVGVSFISAALAHATTVKGTLLGGDLFDFSSALATVTITETAGTNTIIGSSAFSNILNGGTGVDSIFGGIVADTISAGNGANSIIGGAGADTMSGGTGVDTYLQIGGDSVATTASTIAPLYATGSTLTFGNGVDTISNFTVADRVDTNTGANLTVLNGVIVANLVANSNYELVGTWSASTNIFTVNAAGSDALVIADASAAGIAAQTDVIIMTGVTALTTANFI